MAAMGGVNAEFVGAAITAISGPGYKKVSTEAWLLPGTCLKPGRGAG